MKTSIIFADGLKQINFTPENNDERQTLKLITTDDNIQLAIKSGSFGEERFKPFSVNIDQCQGGYLRTFDSSNSVMLVLSSKNKNNELSKSIEDTVNNFIAKSLSNVDTLISDDYKLGFKEGITKYLNSLNEQ